MKLAKLSNRATRLAGAACVATTAAVIGLYVHSGSPTQASAVQPERAKKIAPKLASADQLAIPEMPRATTPAPQLPVRTVALNVSTDVPIAEMPKEESAPLLGCDINVEASQAVAAMVNLDVTATCLPNARVVIEHAGLRFTEILDDAGVLGITVPAMQVDASFEVTFPNGSTAEAETQVNSLQFYDRVALQWLGESGLQIHAMEFGAAYGDDGHIWYGNTRDLTAVLGGQGGFLLRLGDGLSEVSQMADVYTFPTANAAVEGAVHLSVEAEVNGSNCGRDISASSMQIQQGDLATTRQLEIAMPDCAASGDFLVLKNLLQDLTIAQK